MRLNLTGPWHEAKTGFSYLSGLPESAVEQTFGPIAETLSAVYQPSEFSLESLIDQPNLAADMGQQIHIAISHLDPQAVDDALKRAVYERSARLTADNATTEIPALLAMTDAAGLLYNNSFAKETSRTLRSIQNETKAEKVRESVERFKLINSLAAGIDGITIANAVTALPPELEKAPIPLKRPEQAEAPAAARPNLASAHNPTQLLDMILSGPDIEAMAPYTHDVAWKAGKDKDLADPNNPFLGHGAARIKVSEEIKSKSKADLEAMFGRALSDEKFRAIQMAPVGKDITHPLYMPFAELVGQRPDGGTRDTGTNSLSLMALALHLADKRTSDIRTWEGLKRVLHGYIDGSDVPGLAELAKDLHIGFSGGQVVYGERGEPNIVKNTVRVDQVSAAAKQGVAALRTLIESMPDERTIPARIDLKSFSSLTPALQALDVENVMPAAKWLLERVESLFETRHDPHELFGLLGMGPKEIDSLRVLQGSLEIEKLRALQSEFKAAYDATKVVIDAAKKSDRPKAEKAKAVSDVLWALVDSFGVEKLGPEQLATVFYAFKDAGLFADMAQLYLKSNNKTFQSSQVIAELYAVALHKSGDIDQAETAIRKLMKEGKASSETAAILAKVYLLRHDDLKEKDPAVAQTWLQRSIDTLERGFLQDFYYYPGIKLVYNLFTQGVESGDPAKFERAREIAELVHIASRKAGGERSSNYWVVGTLLEASVILGRDKDIDNALPQVLRAARVDWEVDATLASLRTMRAQIASLGDRIPDSTSQLARFDRVIQALEARLEEIHRGEASNAAAASEADQKAARLFEVGTYFGEISSNFVPGTIEYSGQQHSQLVNGWDIDVGREYLRHLGLLDAPKDLSWEEEVERVNERLDEEIRARLGTDKLQYSMSEQHHELDEDAQSINHAMGVAKGVDSRTNIMVDYFMGRVGESENDHGKLDCRPHARLKQLLFDIWKAERANAALATAYQAKLAGDKAAYAAATKRADRIARTFMLTFNSKVESHLIQVRGHSYAILMRRDETGVMRPVLTPVFDSDPFQEAHTYNAIIEVDESGALASFTLADAFYHWPYRLGGKDPETGRYGIRVPLGDISADGRINVRGAINAHNPVTGSPISVGATLAPADWSVGGQQKQVQAVFDELGEPRFRGILIGGLPTAADGKPDVSAYFDPKITDAVGHLATRMRKESAAAVRKSLGEALARLDGLDTVADMPPAIEEWRQKIEWLARQEGIPTNEDNLKAIFSMLKVAPVVDRESSDEPFGQHQIVVKPGTNPEDRFGFAAILVANEARPYVDRHRPYIKHWKVADRLARHALEETEPDGEITEKDVDDVLNLLDVSTIATGRGHYALQLAN